MAKKLTKEEIDARMEAFEEAASHLELAWDMSPKEKEAGEKVSSLLRSIAKTFYKKHAG